MTATRSKAVAKEETKALVSMQDMEADAGGGFEQASARDYAIPFIQILQKGSPPIDPDHPKHKEIPGAKIGSLFNTVTEEVVDGDKGLLVIPCHFKPSFIEWADRDAGGGFVAEHSVAEGEKLKATTSVDDKGRDVLPSGNYLVDTATHYVLVVRENGTYYPAAISMASTQRKKSKKWISNMQDQKVQRPDNTMFTAPMWAHTWLLKSIGESNAKGTWRGWDISKHGDVSPELYAAGRDFRKAVVSGLVRTQEPMTDEEAPASKGF